MRKLNFKKRFLLVAIASVPIVFSVVILRSVEILGSGAKSTLIACAKKAGVLLSYASHPENLILATLGVLASIGLVKGTWFFIGQLRGSRELVNRFKSNKSTRRLETGDLGMDVDAWIVDDNRAFALTVGFLRPSIYISSKLIDTLNEDELKSVIFHEHHHQSNHHPLVKLLIGTLKSFLFFVPIMPVAISRLTLRQEVDADSRAIEQTSRESLISAFLKISGEIDGFSKIPTTVSGFSLSKDRFTIILNNDKHTGYGFPFIPSFFSFIVVLAFFASFAWSYTPYVHAQNTNLNEDDYKPGYTAFDGNKTLTTRYVGGDFAKYQSYATAMQHCEQQ